MKIHQLTYLMLTAVMLTVTACSDNLTDDLTGSSASQAEGPAFQWTRAEDVATYATFIRNFGVGYSYNAVKGEFCNWKDIRCQVVDRNYCDFVEQTYGGKYYFYEPTTGISHHSDFRWSQRDYVSSTDMSFREEIDLGFYNKTRRKEHYILETGVEESFYYMLREEVLLYDLILDYGSLLNSYSRGRKNLLTASFRDAVDHLIQADETDVAVIDSFINVWGTHVIIESFLGGKLDIELSNYIWRYKDTGQEHEMTTEEFFNHCNQKEEERKQDGFTWIEHGKLSVNARGGDQSTLTNLLGNYQFDGKATFSLDGITKWRNSFVYNPNDELASNIEMTDMSVVPIWWFIEYIDEDLAERVKAVVEQDVALQRKLLGERNFFSVKFPMRYPKDSCEVQTSTGKWKTFTREDGDDDPMVVNIISGGRVVATVCHEVTKKHIQNDSTDIWVKDTDLWVAYPVYEGVVNLLCGVGVDNQKRVFDVQWHDGRRFLKRRKASNGDDAVATDNYFYINLGQVDTEADKSVSYAPASSMAYYELSGGIQHDGTYRAEPLSVSKEGAHFVIHNDYMGIFDPEILTDIVGFTYDDSQNVYIRNSNYHYIYNPNEMRVVEVKSEE